MLLYTKKHITLVMYDDLIILYSVSFGNFLPVLGFGRNYVISCSFTLINTEAQATIPGAFTSKVKSYMILFRRNSSLKEEH